MATTPPTDDKCLAELAIFGSTFTPSHVQAQNVKTKFEKIHDLKEAEIKRTPGGWTVRCVLRVHLSRYDKTRTRQ